MDQQLDAVRTIPELIALVATRYGERSAIVEEDGSITRYSELLALVEGAASAFIACGVAPGDRVAIWAPNSQRWIIAALGLQAAGAVLVPVNTRMKGREAAYILRRSGAKVLLTVADFLGVNYPALLAGQDLPDLTRTVLLGGAQADREWDDFLAAGRAVASAAVKARLQGLREDDLSDVLFTSGTTGNPKGVMTTHGQNLRLYRVYSRALGLCEEDRYLIVNPFFHVFGYKAGWLSALMRGAAVYPQSLFDVATVLRRIESDRISVLPGPPTIYQSILSAVDWRQFDLSSLRVAITGATTVPVELVRRMRSDLGFQVVLTAYGLTESCGTVSMCSGADDEETIATTCGRPIEGIELKITDDRGRRAAPDTPGEIIMRGYNVMRGYLGDPEETRNAIDPEGWLHTGDVGVLDHRGYLRITGRKKDMFIVGGFNCYPAEIEGALLTHPAILQAAVIGVPDERMGEVGKAFVVVRSDLAPSPAQIVQWCRENMANYKVPRVVEILDQLPFNSAGKVDKLRLRERQHTTGCI